MCICRKRLKNLFAKKGFKSLLVNNTDSNEILKDETIRERYFIYRDPIDRFMAWYDTFIYRNYVDEKSLEYALDYKKLYTEAFLKLSFKKHDDVISSAYNFISSYHFYPLHHTYSYFL